MFLDDELLYEARVQDVLLWLPGGVPVTGQVFSEKIENFPDFSGFN